MPHRPESGHSKKIKTRALVTKQTLKSTAVVKTSITASMQHLEGKLLSSFLEKLEANAAVISYKIQILTINIMSNLCE